MMQVEILCLLIDYYVIVHVLSANVFLMKLISLALHEHMSKLIGLNLTMRTLKSNHIILYFIYSLFFSLRHSFCCKLPSGLNFKVLKSTGGFHLKV